MDSIDNKRFFCFKALVRQSLRMLSTSLRLLTLVAWLGFVFAQAYSYLLLYLYGGIRLVSEHPEATTLLRVFAAYLILLAWNGPTEAFLNAAMSTVWHPTPLPRLEPS